MNQLPLNDPLITATRRQFFNQCGMGLGSVALASLMADKAQANAPTLVNPFAPKGGTPRPRRSGSSTCSWLADRASWSYSTTSPSSSS